MSLEAIVWSLKQRGLTPAERMVLIVLANFTNEDWLSWPKTKTIIDTLEIDRGTCRKAYRALEESNLLTVIPWGDKKTGKQTSNVYYLHGGPNGNNLDRETLVRPGGPLFIDAESGELLSACAKTTMPESSMRQNHHASMRQNHHPYIEDSNRDIKDIDPSHTTRESFRRTVFASPQIEDASDPKIDKRSARNAKKRQLRAVAKQDPDFRKFCEAYPKRDGSDPLHTAFRNWRDLLVEDEEASAKLLIERAEWYAKWIRANGNEETKYVMMKASFLGPEKAGWETDWKEQFERTSRKASTSGRIGAKWSGSSNKGKKYSVEKGRYLH